MIAISVISFLIALNPSLGSIAVGFDGPLKVAFFTIGCLVCMRSGINFRLSRHSPWGLLAVGIFLSLVMAAFVSTEVSQGLHAAAVSNLGSTILVFFLGIAVTDTQMERISTALRWALVIGGLMTAALVYFDAFQSHTVFLGLLRYTLEARKTNHLAIFLGLSIVGILGLGDSRNSRHRIVNAISLWIIVSAFLMLFSKTALLGLAAVAATRLLRSKPHALTFLVLAVGALVLTVLINYRSIYLEYGAIIDGISSGRGRLWYSMSNGGHFSWISSLYEMDSVFIQRTGAAQSNVTSYVHNTAVYLILHIGILGTAAFYILAAYALNRGLRQRNGRALGALALLVYLLAIGGGEQPLEFQKFGSIIFFVMAGLAMARTRDGGAVAPAEDVAAKELMLDAIHQGLDPAN